MSNDTITPYPLINALRHEARYICDRNGIEDLAGYQNVLAWLVHRNFMETIEPWLKAKRSIFATLIPTITIPLDGELLRVEYKMTKEQTSVLTQIDELIRVEAERYGVSDLQRRQEEACTT